MKFTGRRHPFRALHTVAITVSTPRHAVQPAVGRWTGHRSGETACREFFEPARRLYLAAGFVECAPFGDYSNDPNSTFMTVTL
ncbi:N-acetylglutamate synthase [Rhodococcus triatomae BKS 15-14]|nr:N-acetylglutamate synthase [Rhodococcus triatomae BKS 15-14]